MRLVSLTFLALCLPAAAAVYRMLPQRARTGALLILDFAFYGLAAGKAAWRLPLLRRPADGACVLCPPRRRLSA